MLRIFKSNKLDFKTLREMFTKYWFSPNDAYLRAPEVVTWQSVRDEIKYPLLNIGCGDGVMDMSLFEGYQRHFGLDNNPDSVKRAKNVQLYKKVVLSGAEKMPFPDNKFAAVISNSTFEHIEKDVEAVGEVSRVLKKNGLFVFNTTSNKLLETLRKYLDENEIKKLNKRLDHHHYRSLNDWKKILADNNLTLKEHFYYHPQENIKIWVYLYRFATFVPYKREMWSYLRDSRISPFLPKNIISTLWYLLLRKSCSNSFEDNGKWLFMVARKM